MRRHRLNSFEVEPVKLACLNSLLAMVERQDPDELTNASILFRVWHRLQRHSVGNPSYPKHDSYGSIQREIWDHRPQEDPP